MKRSRPCLVAVVIVFMVWVIPAEAQMSFYSFAGAAASRVAEKLVQAFPKVRGLIVSVNPDGTVILDLTSEHGVYPGLELEAFREGGVFKHPVTGEVLGKMEKTVGAVKVVEVREQYSVAELVDQETSVKQGDGVRVTGARILLGLAKVEAPADGEMAARSLAREIKVALEKTGRFEVVDDRMMRSTLMKAGLKEGIPLTDASALGVLRKELRLKAIAAPRMTLLSDGEQVLDVEVLSARTAAPFKVVSAQIAEPQPTVAQAPPPNPAPAPAPAASPPPREESSRPAWLGPPVPEGAPPNRNLAGNPNFAPSWRSQQTYNVQTLPVGVVAIDFGDVDGDGEDELVAITPDTVSIFERKGLFFALESEVPSDEPQAQFLTVDVADINGNGSAEIFVTRLNSFYTTARIINVLQSFVFEWRDGKVVALWEDVPFYLRVLKTPAYPNGLLLAQRMATHEPYDGRVSRYRWDGGRYVLDPSFRLPEGVNIHGFTLVDLNDNGMDEIVRLGPDGALYVQTLDGKKMATSQEVFGLFNHVTFEQPVEDLSEVLSDEIKAERAVKSKYLERRVVVTPLGPGGRPGILVGLNRAKGGIGQLVETFQSVEGSQVLHLAWDGSTISKHWETDFNRRNYVADYGLVRLRDGLAVAVLSLDRGFFRTSEAILETYRLAASN